MEYKIESCVSQKIVFWQFFMAIIVFMAHIGFGGYLEPISAVDERSCDFCRWLVSELTCISVPLYMLLSAFLLYYNCGKHNILEKFFGGYIR